MKDAEGVETYANHPQSITEIRADKAEDGTKWLPRDVLISMLRDIDSGAIEAPQVIFIAYGVRDPDGATRTAFRQAGTSSWETLGLLEAAKLRFWGAG